MPVHVVLIILYKFVGENNNFFSNPICPLWKYEP